VTDYDGNDVCACIEDGVTWTLVPFQHLAPGDLFRFGPSFAGPVWTYSGSGFYRTTLGPDSNATLQQIEGRVWIAGKVNNAR